MPAGMKHWCTSIYSLFLSDRIFGFKCNLGIVNGSICVFLDCTFPGIDSEVILRSFTWCIGAPFSPSGLNCCSPDVPGNELLSFTQTHSSGPAEIALQEFEAQGQVPQLEGTDILQVGKLRHRVCPFSIAKLLLPKLGIPCLPREDRLGPRLWTQVLLPQALDYVAVCVSAEAFPWWLAGFWLPRAQPCFSFRKQRIRRNL